MSRAKAAVDRSVSYYRDDDGLDQSAPHHHCRRCLAPVEEFESRSLLCRPCHTDRARAWTLWKRRHPDEVRWLRDNRFCGECGEPADQIDHIIPRVAGGPDKLSNLRPLCGRCNASKGGRWDASVLVH